jgi:5-deoxy-glucuronate isomerase
MTVVNEWFHPRGALARDGWESVIDQHTPNWRYTGLQVGVLDGGEMSLQASDVERMIVPLAGSFEVAHGGQATSLSGRSSVFDGPTDVLYVGASQAVEITGRGRVAVASSPTSVRKQSQYLGRADVPLELRGAGADTRQVHNFGFPGGLDAVNLLVCEVITPAGNWSSHPAHKHDTDMPDVETVLDEIYYFEAANTRGIDAPDSAEPFGSFATSSSSAGEIETRALVRSGDIALVPYGYHGPAAAVPEYDLYYLNVMAGPGGREWLFSDDPSQSWIRTRWSGGPTDPRLPYLRPTNSRSVAP